MTGNASVSNGLGTVRVDWATTLRQEHLVGYERVRRTGEIAHRKPSCNIALSCYEACSRPV